MNVICIYSGDVLFFNIYGNNNNMTKFVIIVAGGSGLRMGGSIPKQFIKIGNEPLLMHTLRVFYLYDSTISIILVLPKEQIDYWKKLCNDYHFIINHSIVTGGETRFQSVKNGLMQVMGNGVVAIHDGVRPFISIETISRCFDVALNKGNAIPFVDSKESIRILEEEKNYAIDRVKIKMIQTPQVFKVDLIKEAYNQEYQESFTDDASVFEKKGHSINLVEGNIENIKITTPIDLDYSELIFNRSK